MTESNTDEYFSFYKKQTKLFIKYEGSGIFWRMKERNIECGISEGFMCTKSRAQILK